MSSGNKPQNIQKTNLFLLKAILRCSTLNTSWAEFCLLLLRLSLLIRVALSIGWRRIRFGGCWWSWSPIGLSRPLASPLALGQLSLQTVTIQVEILQSLQGQLCSLRVTVVQEGPVLSSLPGEPQRGGLLLPEGGFQLTNAQAGRDPPQVNRGHTQRELTLRRDFTPPLLWALLLPVLSTFSLSSLVTSPAFSSAFFPHSRWALSAFPFGVYVLLFGFSHIIRVYVLPWSPPVLPFGRTGLTRLGGWGGLPKCHILSSLLLQSKHLLQDGDLLQLFIVQLKTQKWTGSVRLNDAYHSHINNAPYLRIM